MSAIQFGRAAEAGAVYGLKEAGAVYGRGKEAGAVYGASSAPILSFSASGPAAPAGCGTTCDCHS